MTIMSTPSSSALIKRQWMVKDLQSLPYSHRIKTQDLLNIIISLIVYLQDAMLEEQVTKRNAPQGLLNKSWKLGNLA